MKFKKIVAVSFFIFLSGAGFIGCQKEPSTSLASNNNKVAVDDGNLEQKGDLTLTPYGWVPSKDVTAVDANTKLEIKNGHLQKVDLKTGKVMQDLGPTSNKPERFAFANRSFLSMSTAASSTPTLGNGYNVIAPTPSLKTIKSFVTKWKVPSEPNTTKTLFLFNGLQSGALQPVLSWANPSSNKWRICNWYFLDGYKHGEFIDVAAGTNLEAVITLVSQTDSDYTYKESFTGYPDADVTFTRPKASGVMECWEAYTDTYLDFPPDQLVKMTDINLTYTDSTHPDTLAWSVGGTAKSTPSGKNSVIVNNSGSNGEVDLYFQ